MIYLAGEAVPGFAIGDERGDRLRAAFKEILDNVRSFSQSLNDREKLILEIGLAASHMEESLAHGDWQRAEAHMTKLAELSERFRAAA